MNEKEELRHLRAAVKLVGFQCTIAKHDGYGAYGNRCPFCGNDEETWHERWCIAWYECEHDLFAPDLLTGERRERRCRKCDRWIDVGPC